MTGPCRFEPVLPCTGAFTLSSPDCNDECRGPVQKTREPKPAAPVTREEETTMPSSKKPTPATCPECKRPDQVLYNCKYQPGAKYCQRCNAKFANRAKNGHKPLEAPVATKPASAPASKAPGKIAKARPAQAASAPARLSVPVARPSSGTMTLSVDIPMDTRLSDLVAAFSALGMRVGVSVG